jgi:cysteine-rich repeat protein
MKRSWLVLLLAVLSDAACRYDTAGLHEEAVTDTSPWCGNAQVEAGESCDGDCPTSCDDGDACTVDATLGSVNGCDLHCEHRAIAGCGPVDGCCPAGCHQLDDGDCAPLCGNQVVELGERCDGNCPPSCADVYDCTTDVLVGSAASCDAMCEFRTIQACGAAEGCCPAGCNNATDPDCSPSCGNGAREASESCDDGNGVLTDACPDGTGGTCEEARCGDGFVRTGVEQCDDGNGLVGDACPDGPQGSCQPARCGDGFVRTGVEQCDDGNDAVTDICPSGPQGSCRPARCGDGFVRQGVEGCDDGNDAVTDACPSGSQGGCQPARCGDGFVRQGVEQCDDGNDSGSDACVACQPARCGDGFVRQGVEGCDDGNPVNDDGCTSECTSRVLQLAAGGAHSCALIEGGLVRCWGDDTFGQLGRGPVSVAVSSLSNVLVGGPVVQLASGEHHTCALLGTGAVRCWGRNQYGQLGYGHEGTIGDDEFPASAGDVPLGGQKAIFVAAGGKHSCAILEGGAVVCWGDNREGELGLGHKQDIGDEAGEMPPAPVPLGGAAVELALGADHGCARREGGAVVCWGDNSFGELGLGHKRDIGDDAGEMPPAELSLGGPAAQLVVGGDHGCARLQSGAVRCWGRNDLGQLGQGNTAAIGDDELPDQGAPLELGGGLVGLAAGGQHSCARLASGALRCWGSNAAGQLGVTGPGAVGDAAGEMPPADALGGAAVRALGLGGSHGCVELENRTVRCFGSLTQERVSL